MAAPTNPAEALAKLLWRVIQSGENTFAQAWQSVLNSDVGSPDFIRRHGAVVGLVGELQAYLDSLPEDNDIRQHHIMDIPAYYNAVVYIGDWNAEIKIEHGLIDQNVVRLLGSLGMNIKLNWAGYLPTDDDIEKLKTSLKQWQEMLESSAVPDDIAEQIRTQLKKIFDLLSDAELLGYGPAIKESQTLFGMGMRALARAKDVAKVVGCVTSLFEVLTHLSVGDWGSATNALTGAFNVMGEALQVAQRSVEGQKAIKGYKQPALEGNKQRVLEAAPAKPKKKRRKKTKDDDIVDAEVVEDDE